jgi:hypothetical protein
VNAVWISLPRPGGERAGERGPERPRRPLERAMWIERTVFRSKTTGVLLALAVSAVTAALIAAWWWSRDGHEAAPPVPPPVEASKALPADPGASAATAPPPSIDPADLDALARAASADPLYRRVVARGDLLRRAAVVLENLAQGDSPRLAL